MKFIQFIGIYSGHVPFKSTKMLIMATKLVWLEVKEERAHAHEWGDVEKNKCARAREKK